MARKDTPLLDTLEGFKAMLKANPDLGYDERDWPEVDGLYCSKCCGVRRVRVTLEASPDSLEVQSWLLPADELLAELAPSIFYLTCLQCESLYTALIYKGPDGPSLVVLPSVLGGITTLHTPRGVAYYLDQAQRAQAIGANSAAVAMYRSALEYLLYDQGYSEIRELGPKIAQLERDIKEMKERRNIDEGKAPEWARGFDPQFLLVMKNLGNAAIHPNDGDVSKQEALDTSLIEDVKVTLAELLDVVYEQPHQRRERLARLKSTAEALKA